MEVLLLQRYSPSRDRPPPPGARKLLLRGPTLHQLCRVHPLVPAVWEGAEEPRVTLFISGTHGG